MFVLGIWRLNAQSTMVLQFTDNTEINTAINNIHKITFTGTEMNIKLSDGDESEYSMEDIAKIKFSSISDDTEK